MRAMEAKARFKNFSTATLTFPVKSFRIANFFSLLVNSLIVKRLHCSEFCGITNCIAQIFETTKIHLSLSI